MPYRIDGYAKWLTDHTGIWRWGAFEYPLFTVYAPVGTLGEPADWIASQVAAETEREMTS